MTDWYKWYDWLIIHISEPLKRCASDAEQKTMKRFEAKIDSNNLKKLQVPLKIAILKTKVKVLKGYQSNNTSKALDYTYATRQSILKNLINEKFN